MRKKTAIAAIDDVEALDDGSEEEDGSDDPDADSKSEEEDSNDEAHVVVAWRGRGRARGRGGGRVGDAARGRGGRDGRRVGGVAPIVDDDPDAPPPDLLAELFLRAQFPFRSFTTNNMKIKVV